MTENEKIEKLLKEYEGVIKSTDMDVCKSLKGRWYFLRYSEEYGYYECFRQFSTAEELIHMMHSELMVAMNDTLEYESDLPVYEEPDLGDIIE